MKSCPTCRRSYADDTLRFCLEDGTELSLIDEREDPHRTEKFPAAVTQAAHNAVRVDIPTSQTTAPRPTQQTSKSSSLVLKILIAIVALGIVVVVAAVGLLGLFYYLGSRQTVVSNQSPTPVPTVSPTGSPYEITLGPNDNSQTLEDKIKEIQKKLEEASKPDSNNDIPLDPDDLPSARTAKVNSPNDGFLALRNLPSTEIGSLVAKIPHGSTINVLICSEQSVKVGGRSGHWCMVSYNNQTGWVFDVWLTFGSKKAN